MASSDFGPPVSLLSGSMSEGGSSKGGVGSFLSGGGLQAIGGLYNALSGYSQGMMAAEQYRHMGKLEADAYRTAAQSAKDIGKFNISIINLNETRANEDLRLQAYYQKGTARTQMANSGLDIGSGSFMSIVAANNNAVNLQYSRMKQTAGLERTQAQYEADMQYNINMNNATAAEYKANAQASQAEGQAEDQLFNGILGIAGTVLGGLF